MLVNKNSYKLEEEGLNYISLMNIIIFYNFRLENIFLKLFYWIKSFFFTQNIYTKFYINLKLFIILI